MKIQNEEIRMKIKTKARRNIFRRIHNGSKLENPQLVKKIIKNYTHRQNQKIAANWIPAFVF